MESTNILDPHQIESISTKFYYKNNKLCFQIAIGTNGNIVLIKNFENTEEYQKDHHKLAEAVNKNKKISLSFYEKMDKKAYFPTYRY